MSIPERSPVKVKIQTVKRKPVTRKILGEGPVVSTSAFLIHSRGSGHVEKVYVKNGDRIKIGDTLLVLEYHEQKLSLAAARILRDRSAYAFESEKMGYDVVPPDTVIHALKLSSGLAEAEMGVTRATYNLKRQILLSSSGGFLLDWNVSPGQAVNPQQLLGRIIPADGLCLEVAFPETDIRLLRPGMKGRGISLAGDSLQCVLSRVIPRVDEKGMIKTIWKPHHPEELIPGQHCAIDGELILREGIFVPRTAIVQRGDNTMVFVARNDTARWINVQTGWHSEHNIEIRSGLKAGDHVLVSNQYAINEGTPIEQWTD